MFVMNAAHAHLLLNHIPVIGAILGLIVLVWGFYRKNSEVRTAAMLVFVIVALLSIPAYLTGEPAEEMVEDLPGVSHDLIHEHEEAAEFAIWVMQGLGLASLVGLFFAWKKNAVPNWLNIAILALALASAAAMARTANLGGVIRHPEISGPAQGQAPPAKPLTIR
jgi:hypothetical protein